MIEDDVVEDQDVDGRLKIWMLVEQTNETPTLKLRRGPFAALRPQWMTPHLRTASHLLVIGS